MSVFDDTSLRSVVGIDDSRYPIALRRLGAKAPERLHFIGEAEALLGCVRAFVTGTRRATPYGLACAKEAARATTQLGATVITGGGLGCETEAISEALLDGGTPVVWLGTGADVPYPHTNSELFEDVVKAGGCLVSAELWGSPATRHAFVARREYLAAMSDVAIVCEAGLRSGVLDLPLHEDCELFAFPGSIFSPESAGTNDLIYSSLARPVTDEATLRRDLTEAFGLAASLDESHLEHAINDYDRPLASALAACPMRPAELADALGRSTVDVLRELAEREADGNVVRLPDGRYSLSLERHVLSSSPIEHSGSIRHR